MRFKKKTEGLIPKMPLPSPALKPELYWEQVAEKVLSSGVSPDNRRIYNVRLAPNRTSDDLKAFFSTIKPCPEWDACVAAEFRDLIIITDSGKRR